MHVALSFAFTPTPPESTGGGLPVPFDEAAPAKQRAYLSPASALSFTRMAPGLGRGERRPMLTGGEASPADVPGNPGEDDDQELLLALRRRDEQAFTALVDRYHARLVRLAGLFVANQAVAEEVAQETWIGVLQGIDRFEGRSSFRTWLFRILTNQAKRRGQREARSLPFAAFSAQDDADDGEPAVAPDRFLPAGHEWVGHWVSFPQNWHETPEEWFLSHETRALVQQAIDALPPNQRIVITMRDVEGLPSEEVCNALGISETNQRVLLHRARSKVRGQLEQYLEGI
jgi:RNA polymerase sigma-70 factor (ECF subfamily)